jgi:hypothetical protein
MKAAALALVALLLLAGCGAPSSSPPATPPPHQGRWEYSTFFYERDQYCWCYHIGGAVTIVDADLQPVEAIPLHNCCRSGLMGDPVAWASSDFRLVRAVTCQLWLTGDCASMRMDWSVRGMPMPLGIGIPMHLNGTRLDWVEGDPSTAIELQVETTDEGAIHIAGLEQAYEASHSVGIPGPIMMEAWYPPGSMFPDRIRYKWRTPQPPEEMRLVTTVAGGPRYDALPSKPIPGQAADDDYLAFPGEQQDPFGLGYTPRQALDWLLSQESEAASALEDGCIGRFEMRPPQNQTALPGVDLALYRDSQITIEVHRMEAVSRRWSFAYRESALDSGFTNPSGSESDHIYGCARSRPPGSLAGAQHLEEELAFLHESRWHRFIFTLPDRDSGRASLFPAYNFVYNADGAATFGVGITFPELLSIRADNLLVGFIAVKPSRIGEIDSHFLRG